LVRALRGLSGWSASPPSSLSSSGRRSGMVAAWRRGTAGWRRASLVDSVLVPFGLMLGALPSFWIALILLYFIAFKFGVVSDRRRPEPRRGDRLVVRVRLPHPSRRPSSDHLDVHIDGPVDPPHGATTCSPFSADDYVKFARAKGLRDRHRRLPLRRPQRHPAGLLPARLGPRHSRGRPSLH